MRVRWRRWARLDANQRFELRLVLAFVATVVLGGPFLILLLLVRDDWTPLLSLDESVADELHEVALSSTTLVDALQTVSNVFDPNVFRVVATILAIWLFRLRRRRLAGWVLVTIWGSALLGVLLKELVGRARPSFADAVALAGGRSFPSGHALGSLVGCGVLLLVLIPLLRRRWRVAAWAGAVAVVLAVGFARVGLGVHFVSDVVAGWVLGLGWLALTTAAFEVWRQETGQRPTSPAEGLEPDLADHPRVAEDQVG